MNIKFPVFLREKDCGDITKYSSASEMQNDLERIDIENEEYEVWNSQGALLKLSVQDPMWLKVELDKEKSEDYRKILLEFAKQNKIEIENPEQFTSDESLYDFIEKKLNS
ncbi:MAG: hypothetical protein KAI43_09100 [Candidatus Aureabacteria bacterium]|nr:hypothetical protein [Candidatus Auribacterota bacterium]